MLFCCHICTAVFLRMYSVILVYFPENVTAVYLKFCMLETDNNICDSSVFCMLEILFSFVLRV
jgi:hypothetical protein